MGWVLAAWVRLGAGRAVYQSRRGVEMVLAIWDVLWWGVAVCGAVECGERGGRS